jgi:hypothetical protein
MAFVALKNFRHFGVLYSVGEPLPKRARNWHDLRKLQRQGFVSLQDREEAATPAPLPVAAPRAAAPEPAPEPEQVEDEEPTEEPEGGDDDTAPSAPRRTRRKRAA